MYTDFHAQVIYRQQSEQMVRAAEQRRLVREAMASVPRPARRTLRAALTAPLHVRPLRPAQR